MGVAQEGWNPLSLELNLLTLDVLNFPSVSEKMRFVLYIFILLYFILFYSGTFMTHFRTIMSLHLDKSVPFWVINVPSVWQKCPKKGHKCPFFLDSDIFVPHQNRSNRAVYCSISRVMKKRLSLIGVPIYFPYCTTPQIPL